MRLASAWVGTESSAGTPKWLFFGTAGVGAVAAGLGSVFAVQAWSKSNDELAENRYLRDQEAQDDIGDLSTRANVLFIASGVIGPLAAAFLHHRRKDSGGRRKASRVPRRSRNDRLRMAECDFTSAGGSARHCEP